ncbi:MAG: APC family permease [Candidatus Binatia bacterium]
MVTTDPRDGEGKPAATDPAPQLPPRRLGRVVFGDRKDPLSPTIFHQVSLVAFLAWVGLGADGLSSSCYGPEEAYLALGNERFLALFLVVAMTITVLVISASYSQIIELFPTGGGGYLVATKLLGPLPGVISGCALVFDYVLTIAISIASGADAIFSFLPETWLAWKVVATVAAVAALVLLNLRGVKESVTVLVPIFIGFLITHVVVIVVAVTSHAHELPGLVVGAVHDTRSEIGRLGFMTIAIAFLRAYSLGGGTYTGIEAVSNGLQILREPKVRTGKRTMLYMAISLAFTAGGILLSYLLLHVHHEPGRTLNATLIEQVAGGWHLGGVPIGHGFLLFTLMSEGALLFVAAQAGFLDGPRVLANMAVDSWVPHRFYQLSDRLVTKNGILIMGSAALAVLLYTAGQVRLLVVLYSINVFLTFSLSQLGMCVHWWQERTREPRWLRRLTVNGIGLALTSSILVFTTVLKFEQGGWITVAITAAFVGGCLYIRRHYRTVERALHRLDDELLNFPIIEHEQVPLERDVTKPTAVVLVTDYNGIGLHSVLAIPQLFGSHFHNFVFVSVGVIDSSRFKGADEIDHLKCSTEAMLKRYVDFVRAHGRYGEYWYALGTDAVDELEKLCAQVAKTFRRPAFFAGKLVFQEENFLHRQLHNQASMAIQRRLQFQGLQMIVLPVRAL